MGEEAIDTGGPTREFWRLIMQAFQEVKEKRVLIRTYLHSMKLPLLCYINFKLWLLILYSSLN